MTGWSTATGGSRAIAASVRRGPVVWLVLCGAVLAVAILIGTAAMIGQFRERALANGERELENTVLLLTRHFDQQFEDSSVIARNIDPANFEKFFASVALGKGAAISMFHGDGTLIARHPHVASMIGQKLNSPLLNSIQATGGIRTMRVKSPVDGQDRLGAGHPVP